MNVELDEHLSRIRPEAPHAPRDLIVLTMVDVLRDFCLYTRAFTYEVTDEVIQANVSDYDVLVPNTDVEPIAIEHMELNGTEVFFKDVAWLNYYIANWRLREADDFRYFTQFLGPKTYTFPCVPVTAQTGLYYRVALRPVATATVADEDFLAEWIEPISDGTKARLLAMSGKLWSDPKRAKELEGQYRNARGQARIRVSRGYGNAEQRWSNPRGFA